MHSVVSGMHSVGHRDSVVTGMHSVWSSGCVGTDGVLWSVGGARNAGLQYRFRSSCGRACGCVGGFRMVAWDGCEVSSIV
jgi:hypothetical protein